MNIIILFSKIIFFVLKLFPLNKKRIIMECDYGKGFYGNLLYIYEELEKHNHDYEIIIPINKGVSEPVVNRSNTKIINTKTLKHLYYLATAKFWITSNHYYFFLKPKKETVFINTWHSIGRIKKIGIHSTNDKKIQKRFITEGPRIDWFMIGSEHSREMCLQSLCLKPESIISIGIPRTDPFFNENIKNKHKEEFYNRFPNLKTKKIILYAPTFRDNEKENFVMKIDFEKFQGLFSQGYILILKLHPVIRNKYKVPVEYTDYVYDMSKDNINTLMFVSDILITDYSSVFFEYALLEKPIIFYAYDLEEYMKKSREFYYDYRSFVPGPIVFTSEEIVDIIKNNNYDYETLKKFSNEHCAYKDGRSSERFVKRFLLSNN